MSTDDKESPSLDRLDSLIGIVNQIAVDLREVKTRLESLEEKVDTRLRDTTPMWEAVRTQVTEMHVEMRNGFREVERRLDVMSIDINKIRGDMRYIDERVSKLERVEEPGITDMPTLPIDRGNR